MKTILRKHVLMLTLNKYSRSIIGFGVALLVAGGGGVAGGAAAFAGPTYTAVLSGNPPGTSSSGPTGINASGQVVASGGLYAYLYSGDVWTDIGLPSGSTTASPAGINDSGQIIGTSASYVQAFLWTPLVQNGIMGSIVDLGALGGLTSQASAINDLGEVVGAASTDLDSIGPPPAGPTRAFVWQDWTGMTDLGALPGGQTNDTSAAYAINSTGQIVGSSTINYSPPHAFLWTPSPPGGASGSMVDLGEPFGFPLSQAQGINSGGQVVGFAEDPGDVTQAFLWSPTTPSSNTGNFIDLGTHFGSSIQSIAEAVNDSGTVVGFYGSGASSRAFVYSAGGEYDLTDITSGLSRGEVLTNATAINGSGYIVAAGSKGTYILE